MMDSGLQRTDRHPNEKGKMGKKGKIREPIRRDGHVCCGCSGRESLVQESEISAG